MCCGCKSRKIGKIQSTLSAMGIADQLPRMLKDSPTKSSSSKLALRSHFPFPSCWSHLVRNRASRVYDSK